jgi:hypothetical protein
MKLSTGLERFMIGFTDEYFKSGDLGSIKAAEQPLLLIIGR